MTKQPDPIPNTLPGALAEIKRLVAENAALRREVKELKEEVVEVRDRWSGAYGPKMGNGHG
jgi:predicted nuclease with TOPRIM domain